MAEPQLPPPHFRWTTMMLVPALFPALVVTTQFLAVHYKAYMAAPNEILTLIDAIDFSVQENEAYDTDLSRVVRLEDKLRLNRLLREIQKGGDDLREELNRLLVSSRDGAVLRTSARILWGIYRRDVEEKVKRLDMLRMRFLVVHTGIVVSTAERKAAMVPLPPPPPPPPPPPHMGLLTPVTPRMGAHAALSAAIKEAITKRPNLRRTGIPIATTSAHSPVSEMSTLPETPQICSAPPKPAVTAVTPRSPVNPMDASWMGVVQELQRSPRMRARHASVELSIRRTVTAPMPPLSSSIMDSPVGSNTIDSLLESPTILPSLGSDSTVETMADLDGSPRNGRYETPCPERRNRRSFPLYREGSGSK